MRFKLGEICLFGRGKKAALVVTIGRDLLVNALAVPPPYFYVMVFSLTDSLSLLSEQVFLAPPILVVGFPPPSINSFARSDGRFLSAGTYKGQN